MTVEQFIAILNKNILYRECKDRGGKTLNCLFFHKQPFWTHFLPVVKPITLDILAPNVGNLLGVAIIQ